MTSITLTLKTQEQANALLASLDLYSRLGTGQLEHLVELFRDEIVPVYGDPDAQRKHVELQALERIEQLLDAVKSKIGLPPRGSMGIGHPHVHASVHHAYEMFRVISGALPNRGGGLAIRYTDAPAPECVAS